jgi:GH15 family glucan-1,4-alpha-glucosidase
MTVEWMAERIADHGLISDGETCALVYSDATIDWLCMPRFDSEACLAALLGNGDKGGWWLQPASPVTASSRRYQGDTLILETLLATETGSVAIIDFMPVRRRQAPDIVRIVEGRGGKVAMTTRLALRFDNGRTHPLAEMRSSGETIAIAGPNAVALRFDAPIQHTDRSFTAEFTVAKGERRCFTMTWFASHMDVPNPVDAIKARDQAQKYWQGWADACCYDGPDRDLVKRSLLTLKALVHAHTGGIVAAPTASLPERPGGSRNWDYRYCWLRDATFALLAFIHAGYKKEARAWINWLRRAVGGEPIDVLPFYTIDASRSAHEREAHWFEGFGGAQPVRLGNAAMGQCQLDIYGEVIDALYVARCHDLIGDEANGLVHLLLAKLETIWRHPDAGIWESRGKPRQHTYSKAMCWVAFERGAKLVQDEDLAKRWRSLAEEVRREVLDRGFDEKVGAFTRAFDDQTLDAAVLRLPIVGLIEADDPRMVATVEAIERELLREGYAMRYSTDETDDGVGGAEGAFLAVTCWLADVYSMQGRAADSQRVFARLRQAANDLGLLSEEIWPEDGRLLGNFPQALSHLALVNTALTLSNQGRPPRRQHRQ